MDIRKSFPIGLRIMQLLNTTLPDYVIQAGNPPLSDRNIQIKLRGTFDLQISR
ncbi:MAG: hypothetical protein IID16_01755 [Candidatus Marinimicrobia bacterium]|nr:hypothetical protein [Candidatus Neomarinimicrobiota bacterium]